MYRAYAAAKYGGKCSDMLFKTCGSWYVDEDNNGTAHLYDRIDRNSAEYKHAQEVLDKIVKNKK